MKIDVFLLAAGESSRMFPLSQIMEKSLLPVDGKPVIRHIVDDLTNCECVGDITICCLRKFESQFMHEFRDVENVGVLSFKNPVGTYTTWYLSVGEEEDGRSEWSMVHYADCLTEIDYNDFISKIDEKYNGLIAVTNTVKHDYSEVSFTVDGVVQDFVEKPKVMNYSWSGIGLFNTKVVEEFRTDDSQDFAFDIFPQMIKKDKLKAYPYNGYWYDMGNLNSYRKVCKLFEEGKSLSEL